MARPARQPARTSGRGNRRRASSYDMARTGRAVASSKEWQVTSSTACRAPRARARVASSMWPINSGSGWKSNAPVTPEGRQHRDADDDRDDAGHLDPAVRSPYRKYAATA